MSAFRDEWLYRAWYGVNALKRVASSVGSGSGRAERLVRAVAAEEGYFAAHVQAQSRRLAAATATDAAVERFGRTLGWYAVLDGSTTPGCRKNHGNNFDADRPPSEGLPGTLHGGECRCSPGAPHRNGRMLA